MGGYMGHRPANGIHQRKSAIFTLNFGENGGVLSPKSIDELAAWIKNEIEFWTWARYVRAGEHGVALDEALLPLFSSESEVLKALQLFKKGEVDLSQQPLVRVEQLLHEAYESKGLPHSSSRVGKAIEGMRSQPVLAIAYVFPFLKVANKFRFDPVDLQSWQGFLSGLIARFNLNDGGNERLKYETDALIGLRNRVEADFAERKNAVDAIHEQLQLLASNFKEASAKQVGNFHKLINQANSEHEGARLKYDQEMADLKKAFKEAMALRGPVEYWSQKALSHQGKTIKFMRWSFGLMIALAIILGLIANWTINKDGNPDTWKLSVLVLVGVLGVWAVRLVVRMYLSHAHLATDAEERVTMVQTYLALIEDGKMTKDEDRALVLTPLFRAATDGIVKDEGLPHPMLELFTRANK